MTRSPLFTLAVLTGQQNVRSPYIRALLRTAQVQGIKAYPLTPSQLFLSSNEESSLHVVYNRIPTRKAEASLEVRRAKQWLQQRGIPLFNQRFFNKREVDRVLRKDEEIRKILPATMSDWDTARALSWLEEYGGLFVKPIGGSFGEGICRTRKVNGSFQLEVRDPGGVHKLSFVRPEECLHACFTRMGNTPFIVQEAISLARYDGCPTDFRVHIHRVAKGHWKVAGIGAKIAHPEGITTHVHSGGRVEDADVVLRSWYGRQANHVREEIEHLAQRVSQKLSNALDPRLGELGLDIGIALDGRVVLFEANAKPGRSIFSHPALRSAGLWSRQAILQYAEWLAMQNVSVGVL
ncbi:YheC/YheD family protein [Sulfoacidibacillus thermotolerans]|uniref:ATP-grasp domain-containing protein n=1 Tax=Sulfoacidibacillus thermotolerans TaxID=1765684 RepID=A0A2U3DAH1_SULT2|nr:YheC/YheD family protein [Sulfoacidibacillus thermotolerans]PWI58253.1 hypothetical protein BM613_04825 [Sulfoacidibacillus thermotolerans]